MLSDGRTRTGQPGGAVLSFALGARGHPGEAEAEEMRDAVRLSVNGIAAGLRNTG